MGSESDKLSVVDSDGRLRGIDGLRIVDASIMPSVPCANTNVTTMMIAEKIADRIQSTD
jgi:5-(hydroxymethyl)furfural/furfural oxidase